MENIQTLLAIIPTLILIGSLARDWWKEKKAQELEQKRIALEESKQGRSDLEDDYARSRQNLADALTTISNLKSEVILKSARIEQLESFIRLLGKQIPD